VSLFGAIADHYVASGGGTTTTSFVASASGTGTTVTKPTGAATGDHLIITVADSSTNGTSAISGFTPLQGDVVRLDDNAGSTGKAKVFYRKVDGSEGSTFTVSGSLVANVVWVATLYRGGTTQPALIGETVYTSTTSTIASRGRAPVAGLMVHSFIQAANPSPSITGPSSPATTRDSAVGTFYAIAMADEVSAAGDDTTRNASTSGKAGASVTLLFPDATMPTLVATGSGQGNSTNARVTVPSGAAAGDLMIVAYEVTNNTISAGPTGFTSIASGQVTGGSFTANYWWGYKVLVSGDLGATIQVTSSSQVWAAACLIIRNPAATPIIAGSTSTGTGHTNPATLQAPTAGAPAMAVTALMNSSGGGSTISIVDPSSIKGFAWTVQQLVGSSFGLVTLNIHSVPNGASALNPNASVPGSGTASWAVSTVLLNV
jgi:hypothetical protein